ncbi:MAG TPA: hypothetical protein VIQ53_11395, partial [Inquilinus sp.]
NGRHPVNAGYDGAARIIGGTRLIHVAPAAGAEQPFLYVPDFPDLPMEEVYPREAPQGAAVVARETGSGGRSVYIPWNIGEIFWEVLALDHSRLIGNAVRWALGGVPQVTIDGPGVVDLALREDASGLALTIVNLTNPMMLKGPVREVLPLGPQRVSIAVPPGRSVAKAALLVAGRQVLAAPQDGRVVIEVPSIDRLEVVHLTWG